MMKKLLFTIIFSALFLAPSLALAVDNMDKAGANLQTVVGRSGVPTDSVPAVAGNVAKWVVGLTTAIFFILMIYAGFKWILSQGEEEKIKKARETIIMASIGLVITVGSYAITTLVTDRLINNGQGAIISSGGNVANPTVCCLDQVQAPSESYLEFHAKYWTWRVTTKLDCETRGMDKNDPQDVLTGEGTFETISCVGHEADCATFCESKWSEK